MTQVMSITDANTRGNVHGGSIMRLVDTAAGVAAMRHAGGKVVTAQVDSLSFLQPVHIGDIITLTALVTQAWTTSMEVEVTVHREDPVTGEGGLTTRAYLTMVAIDAGEQPTGVPELLVETEIERKRQREAEMRRAGRIRVRDEIAERNA